jgi:anaerobic ribonucleoside-triphosphate reductase activating protein
MEPRVVNVARILPRSVANGPGERFVVWVQGCTLRCSGCWNPDTWSTRPRRLFSVDALADEIIGTAGIEGVTLTGGEPFEQAAALADLAVRVQGVGLSVMVFTGYELDELAHPEQQRLLALCDVIVAGRYVRAQRTLDTPWRGSSNQSLHFLSERYSQIPKDVAVCEIHLDANGPVVLTGFPPDELTTEEVGALRSTEEASLVATRQREVAESEPQ